LQVGLQRGLEVWRRVGEHVHEVIDKGLIKCAGASALFGIGDACDALGLPPAQPGTNGDDLGVEQVSDLGAGLAFGREQHSLSTLTLAVGGSVLMQMAQGLVVGSR
jgi:hypothetical protein